MKIGQSSSYQKQFVCLCGVLEDETGLALLSTFENAGAFMINTRNGMLTCDNKMSAYIAFEKTIFYPRTAMISNEKSLMDYKRIGGNYS